MAQHCHAKRVMELGYLFANSQQLWVEATSGHWLPNISGLLYALAEHAPVT
jgi:hypothetical protein